MGELVTDDPLSTSPFVTPTIFQVGRRAPNERLSRSLEHIPLSVDYMIKTTRCKMLAVVSTKQDYRFQRLGNIPGNKPKISRATVLVYLKIRVRRSVLGNGRLLHEERPKSLTKEFIQSTNDAPFVTLILKLVPNYHVSTNPTPSSP